MRVDVNLVKLRELEGNDIDGAAMDGMLLPQRVVTRPVEGLRPGHPLPKGASSVMHDHYLVGHSARRTIMDGEHAAVSYVLTGTLQERLGPFEPARQALELRGVHVFSLAGDAITATEDFWDSGTFARQMRSPEA